MLYDVFILMATLLGINLLSTIPERLFIFAVLVLILFKLGRYLAQIKKKRLMSAAIAGTITLLISIHLSSTILRNFPLIFSVFVLTLFLLSMRLPFAKRYKLVSTFVAGLLTMSISAHVLSDIHRFIFPDQAVTRFATGNYNGLALDMDSRILHVVGHGTNHIHSFNIDSLNAPPKLSEMETGYAATFFYNDRMKEIYNYNKMSQQLDIVDSAELTIKKSVPIQFPPGVSDDTWIEMDMRTGYIVVAAEAKDKQLDKATVIINRTEGKVVKELSLAPMNILLNPSRPLLYMSWWQSSSNEIIAYDLEAFEISNRTPISERVDRMAFLEPVNELLVTIPSKSIIHRLDAETLGIKGKIRSSLGVRTLAVDEKRNLLLTLSLVSGMLDVIDLNTYESIKRYYLAPWLRSIVLDGRGAAYVSSFRGLFKIQYDKPV